MTGAGTMSRVSVIVSAFADSVAEGDFDGAEGWLSLARDRADREDPRRSRDQTVGETSRAYRS